MIRSHKVNNRHSQTQLALDNQQRVINDSLLFEKLRVLAQRSDCFVVD